MKNVGRYRVVLRVEATGRKLVICRRVHEQAARHVANNVAAGLPSGVIAEVFCGIGRSCSRLYAVASSEDGI